MDMKRVRRAIRKVARQHGVSEKQVIADIEVAIAEALTEAKKENNTELLVKWEAVPSEGDVPTAWELLAYLGDKMNCVIKNN